MSVRSLNKVQLIGNITRDPNLRFTPTGAAVCSFGIATNRTWTPAEGGEKQERTEFHNVVAWSKLAEICGSLLHKGDKVYVEGRLQTREWKAEDGQSRRTTEVIIDDMLLLHSRGDYSSSEDSGMSDSAPTSAAAPAHKADSSAASDTSTNDVEDISDDIPF